MSARVLRNLLLGSITTAFVLPLPVLWHQPAQIALAAGPAAPVPAEPPKPTDPGVGNPGFKAALIDAVQKAKQHTATVQVEVSGVRLVDPDATAGKAAPGEGHLHYQVDNGPVVATTGTKLGFHDLPAGGHTIKISLAGNDHKPIAPGQTINVMIPAT